MNKVEQATNRAIQMLHQNGVGYWRVKVTNGRKSLAITDHGERVVELSKRFILATNETDFHGIMLHEIAHILVGPGHGHGEKFKNKCAEIGLDTAYSCHDYPIYIQRYKYICENCGVLGSSEKKERFMCTNCLYQRNELVAIQVIVNTIAAKAW